MATTRTRLGQSSTSQMFAPMRQRIERQVQLYNQNISEFGGGGDGGLMTLTIGQVGIQAGVKGPSPTATRGRHRASARGRRSASTLQSQPVATQASGQQTGQIQQVHRRGASKRKLSAATKASWAARKAAAAQLGVKVTALPKNWREQVGKAA